MISVSWGMNLARGKSRSVSWEIQGEMGHKILILPSINLYSMNIQKRFWSTDNTDINRMFPGYCLGETTQRIAAGRFCPPCAADGRGVQQARDGKAVWPSVCGGPQGKAL